MRLKIIKEVIPEIVGYITNRCVGTLTEYHCPVCGFGISEDNVYCPYCGNEFNWDELKPHKDGKFIDLFSKL